MNKIISAKKISLSEAVKRTVDSRLEYLSSHYQSLIKATCFMKSEKSGMTTEIIISGKGFVKTAKARAKNLYLSIHEAADKMEAQLEKVHGKRFKKPLNLGEVEAAKVLLPYSDEYSFNLKGDLTLS